MHTLIAMNNNSFESIVERLYPNTEGHATLAGVTRLTGGVSADVYRLDLTLFDGRSTSVVLRAHGESHSGHAAQLEFALLNKLHERGLPVPAPILVDESCTYLPHPFLVIEFITGTTGIPASQQNQYIERMADRLAEIHAASTDHLPALPQRLNPLPEVFDFLPEGNEWAELRLLLEALPDTQYQPAPKLLHGDFWPENLLWQNGMLAGVLDWEDAALGDPLSDVAACRVELRYKFGPESMQRFTQAYALHYPVDQWRLALWQVYVAAAAQKYMGLWGLDATRERHMRREALSSIREAGLTLASASTK